jgi:hypothetical protein
MIANFRFPISELLFKGIRRWIATLRFSQSAIGNWQLAMIAIFFALTLAGCGGSGGNSAFVTGITVSPSASISAGDEVAITATVKDSTLFKSAKWSADGGTLAVGTGLTTRWVAPDDLKVAADFTITLLVTQTTGLTSLETVKIHVAPGSSTSNSGARITNITTNVASVAPGGSATATVTVANTQDVISTQWSADIGTLLSNTGFSVQWRAPAAAAQDEEATLTVTTLGVNGDVHSAQVKVLVQTGGGTLSGARITSASTDKATVSLSEIITATVTVASQADVADVQWTANIGTLVSNKGYSVQWRAPDNLTQNQTAVLTVTTTGVNGDTHSAQVNVLVETSTGSLSGARITSASTDKATANPGDIVTATVAVADQSDVTDVQWAANIGTFVSDRGYTVQWRAPDNLTQNQTAVLTVTTTGTNGDVHTAQVRVFVQAGSQSDGSLISKVTVSSGSVTAGGSIAVTVETASGSNIASITWTADGGTLTNQNGSAVAWVAPNVTTQTVFKITVTVLDTSGKTDTETVQVVANPKG